MSGSVVIALIIAVAGFSLIFFIYRAMKQFAPRDNIPAVTMLLQVTNQEQIIEGVLRVIYSFDCRRSIDVYVIDKNSNDQTGSILARLKREFPSLNVLDYKKDIADKKRVSDLVRGGRIYHMDLTTTVNYRLLIKTIYSIVCGTDTCLYRTRLLGEEQGLIL